MSCGGKCGLVEKLNRARNARAITLRNHLPSDAVDIGGLPRIVSASVDWGDGVIETVSLTDETVRVLAEASHTFTTGGTFEILMTLTSDLGQTVSATRTVNVHLVRQSLQWPDGGILQLESDQLLVTGGGVEVFNESLRRLGTLALTGSDQGESFMIRANDGYSLPVDGIQIDGGLGDDRLTIAGSDSSFDLSDPRIVISRFESLRLADGDPIEVAMDAAVVSSLSPISKTLRIEADDGDRISILDAPNWRLGQPITVADRFLLTATNLIDPDIELEADIPNAWQNFLSPSDVNNNGEVTAADALRIINELGRRTFSDRTTNRLVDPLSVVSWPNVYFDQNGDDHVTALDALRVINELARISQQDAAGEEVGPSEAVVRAVALAAITQDADATEPPSNDPQPGLDSPTSRHIASFEIEDRRAASRASSNSSQFESAEDIDRVLGRDDLVTDLLKST